MTLLPAADVLAAHRTALTGPEPDPVRMCFAAAHVVLQPGYAHASHSMAQPGSGAEIAQFVDWDATMGIRRFLDANGFGIAEAMDTAQRFALGWASAQQLITRCGRLGLRNGFVAGAGTDHLDKVRGTADLVDGVVHQVRFIQQAGGWPMILPMPWLTLNGATEDQYVDVYGSVLRQVEGPVFLHWLGEMFLPVLKGYFPGRSFERILALDPAKVRGCKLSLLDDAMELRVRRELLPRDQVVLTGDDFHFGRLILGGDPQGPAPTRPPVVERHVTIGNRRVAVGDFSHALLGILDGIAIPAGLALRHLARGDAGRFLDIMTPCEALGRHVFCAPTQHYKAGLAFLSWLNGLQSNPMLVNREDRCRDAAHYTECAQLSVACGALGDIALAQQRLDAFLGGKA